MILLKHDIINVDHSTVHITGADQHNTVSGALFNGQRFDPCLFLGTQFFRVDLLFFFGISVGFNIAAAATATAPAPSVTSLCCSIRARIAAEISSSVTVTVIG